MSVRIVTVLHLFVRHKLQGTVRHAKHARNESLHLFACVCVCAHKRVNIRHIEILLPLSIHSYNTNLVQTAYTLVFVNLAQTVHHAAVAIGPFLRCHRHVARSIVLQTEPCLYHPDGIRHDQRENARLGCGQHMHRWSERRLLVAALDPGFDRIVAAEVNGVMRLRGVVV